MDRVGKKCMKIYLDIIIIVISVTSIVLWYFGLKDNKFHVKEEEGEEDLNEYNSYKVLFIPLLCIILLMLGIVFTKKSSNYTHNVLYILGKLISLMACSYSFSNLLKIYLLVKEQQVLLGSNLVFISISLIFLIISILIEMFFRENIYYTSYPESLLEKKVISGKMVAEGLYRDSVAKNEIY